MELWDVYNKDRIKLDKTIIRGNTVPKGSYRLIVHICIFNTSGEMLIQQRQPFKEGWSNMWDVTVGGSAVAGDSSYVAAERELFEEIGYKFDLSSMRPHLTINFDDGFDDFYLINSDIDINDLKLQYEEVQAVKWATKEEIFSLIDAGEFIPYYKSLISFLFESKNKYGAHTNY